MYRGNGTKNSARNTWNIPWHLLKKYLKLITSTEFFIKTAIAFEMAQWSPITYSPLSMLNC